MKNDDKTGETNPSVPETHNIDTMVEDLMTIKGDEMDFVITREPTPGATFSKSALDEFNRAIETFVMARVAKHFGDSYDPAVPGPSNMKVEVRVTLDDKHVVPHPDERPWYVVDGTNRGPVH